LPSDSRYNPSMREPDDDRGTQSLVPHDGRSVAIDLLRGLAIMWVVLFHLWGLSTRGVGFGFEREVYYDRFVDRARDGEIVAALTALWDIVLRAGDDGVAAFMILSGVSLTIVTLRHGIDPLNFARRRLARLLIPYWVGWLLVMATFAALALYRVEADGGTFRRNFQYIGFIEMMNADMAIAGLLLVSRGLELQNFTAQPAALWFVLLLLQFYLLFPLLLPVLRRIGPAAFVATCLAVSLASTAWLIEQYGALGPKGYLWSMWAPFRIFEFGLGMAVGWMLSVRPALLQRVFRPWPRTAALLVAAIALHTIGSNINDDHGYWRTIAHPLIVIGLGTVIAATCVAAPHAQRVFASAPVRLLSWIGTISYTVLIVNESFRIVNLYLITMGWQWTAGWWFYVVVMYVPLTVLLAYPLAVVLGLVPRPVWLTMRSFAAPAQTQAGATPFDEDEPPLRA
jgi:peptidoglycan/LPS O-acetylase OafA/YrhL